MDSGLFVIHEHHARRAGLHWDLRLEREGILWSWAIPKGIPEAIGIRRMAIRTPDHDLTCLKFSGTIEEGYGAGTLEIWDEGFYELIKNESKLIVITLHGDRISGSFALIQTSKNWLIIRKNHMINRFRIKLPQPLGDAVLLPVNLAKSLPT